MSCIRQKASGICQHSHKITEKSQVGKGCHLIDHPLLVVIEPPCASLLDLSYDTGILETSDDRSDGCIIVWIQTVQNRLWQLVCYIQCIEQICQLCRWRISVNTVKSRIRSKLAETFYVIVTFTSVMKLHCPSQTMIFSSCIKHKCSLIF